MAVQERSGRSATSVADPQRHLADVDVLEHEAGEKFGHGNILCEKIVLG
jgi:hypothetical protein